MDDKYYLLEGELFNISEGTESLAVRGRWLSLYRRLARPEGATCVCVNVTSQFIYHQGSRKPVDGNVYHTVKSEIYVVT